jgi:hypothetical protein
MCTFTRLCADDLLLSFPFGLVFSICSLSLLLPLLHPSVWANIVDLSGLLYIVAELSFQPVLTPPANTDDTAYPLHSVCHWAFFFFFSSWWQYSSEQEWHSTGQRVAGG